MSGFTLLNNSLRKANVLIAVVVLAYGLPVFGQSLPAPEYLRLQGEDRPPATDPGVTDPGVTDPGVTDPGVSNGSPAPYQHVNPEDVGKTIGVGVVASAPTAGWTGSTTIDVPGTVIENVVINGCLDILAEGVTIRNVVITCAGTYPIDVQAPHLTVEYSKISNTTDTKVFMVSNGGGNNLRVLRSEITGGEDFFFIGGNVDGMTVENNYMHSSIGTSEAHADGFQIGAFDDTYGTMTIRGNYIWQNNPTIGSTDIVFPSTYARPTLLVENNFFRPWGYYTLRCNKPEGPITCIARNNVYSSEFMESPYSDRPKMTAFDEFTCNRYQNGSFLSENTGDTSSCPAF